MRAYGQRRGWFFDEGDDIKSQRFRASLAGKLDIEEQIYGESRAKVFMRLGEPVVDRPACVHCAGTGALCLCEGCDCCPYCASDSKVQLANGNATRKRRLPA